MTEEVGGHFENVNNVSWILKLLLRIFEDSKLLKIQNVWRVMNYDPRRDTNYFMYSKFDICDKLKAVDLLNLYDFVWKQRWLYLVAFHDYDS